MQMFCWLSKMSKIIHKTETYVHLMWGIKKKKIGDRWCFLDRYDERKRSKKWHFAPFFLASASYSCITKLDAIIDTSQFSMIAFLVQIMQGVATGAKTIYFLGH